MLLHKLIANRYGLIYSIEYTSYDEQMQHKLNIQQDIELQSRHTFALAASAEKYLQLQHKDQLPAISQYLSTHPQPYMVLGGGSNTVFAGHITALIIHNQLRGIDVTILENKQVRLEVAAGENWHQLVEYCVQQQYAGIENLALIPGSVGAAPVQNIGAYGVELSNCLEHVTVYDLQQNCFQTLSRAACKFGYRDSIFKHTPARERYIITSISLQLDASSSPQLHASYASLNHYLQQHHILNPRIQDIYRAVIAIRQSKLPDPAKLANAGSFFKNPIISQQQLAALQANHPEIPHHPATENHFKLSAGWLLEQCGWKGKRSGDLGCYEKQALILVHYGGAKATELQSFIKAIQQSVYAKFCITLEPEVNLIMGA